MKSFPIFCSFYFGICANDICAQRVSSSTSSIFTFYSFPVLPSSCLHPPKSSPWAKLMLVEVVILGLGDKPSSRYFCSYVSEEYSRSKACSREYFPGNLPLGLSIASSRWGLVSKRECRLLDHCNFRPSSRKLYTWKMVKNNFNTFFITHCTYYNIDNQREFVLLPFLIEEKNSPCFPLIREIVLIRNRKYFDKNYHFELEQKIISRNYMSFWIASENEKKTNKL